VLLRLAYLAVMNMFALLQLLQVSDQAKEAEILALRHQIIVLERQLGKARPRFSLADRAFLAALLYRLPRDVLGRFRLLIRPETVLRWHRDLLARRHAAGSRPRRPSRSPRPAHPAVLNRRDFVEAAPALPGDPRLRLPPASPRRCDDGETKVFHLRPEHQRLVAHPLLSHATARPRQVSTSFESQTQQGGRRKKIQPVGTS
jgi:hypothetical protein